MGVDVLLYVEVSPAEAELDAAEEYFYARSNVADRYEPEKGRGWRSLAVEAAPSWNPGQADRVVANLTCRYWGPGYERGDWPGIYGAIRLLQHLFPNAKVFYGGDSSDEGLEVDEEWLAEYWAHWLGPDGDNYRAYLRARFPSPAAAPSPDREPEPTPSEES